MSTKRKNHAQSDSQHRTLPLLLIGIGVLVLMANAVFSIARVTVDEQMIGDVATTIGEAAGDAGREVGQAAGEVGREIGAAAGDVGRTLGETVGDLGGSFGRAAGNLWPLLLVIIGLGLIVRRPMDRGKVKNEVWHETHPGEQDVKTQEENDG
jgi:hypothetical protein